MDGEMERVLPDDADDGAERRWIDDTLNRLSRSSFRAKFELSAKDRAYARAKGKAMIDRHARELLRGLEIAYSLTYDKDDILGGVKKRK